MDNIIIISNSLQILMNVRSMSMSVLVASVPTLLVDTSVNVKMDSSMMKMPGNAEVSFCSWLFI